MKIDERKRGARPKATTDDGLGTDTNANAEEREAAPSRERDDAVHPVDRVIGILGKPGSTDEYLKWIRGIAPDTDVDGHAPPNSKMLLDGESDDAPHPVDRVVGILGKPGSADEYMKEIRGTAPDTDVDGHAPPNSKMLLDGESDDALHPVDRVYGILGKPGSTDEYLAEIRGTAPDTDMDGESDDAPHPVDRVVGILGKPGSTDEYLKWIRGQ